MSADDKTVKRHSAIKSSSNLKRKRERPPTAPYFHPDAGKSITLPQINVRYAVSCRQIRLEKINLPDICRFMEIVTKSLYGREKKRKQKRGTTNVKTINLIHVCVISALRRGRLTTTNSVLSIDVVRRGRNETTRGAATLVGHVEVAAARSCSCVLVLPARTTAFSERDSAVSNGTELYILAESARNRECVEVKPQEGATDSSVYVLSNATQ